MFNHYRDIRASGKVLEDLAEVRLLSAGSWALNGRWRPGAHIAENVEANFLY